MRPLRLLAFLLVAALTLHAQTVPVVMLSDIHFDPFHDPAKVSQLRAEPIDRWPAILNSPASKTQAADALNLQSTCGSRAQDPAWPLLKITLAAAHSAEAHPLFVTLSGDLLTHEFPCRFRHLAANSTPADLATFAEKTTAFVLAQLRQTYPRAPIYATLGNNDSGCNDYRETPNDSFLKQATDALRAATLAENITFTPEGDYAVPLPAPMEHTRLIVVEDIFEAQPYATCAGNPDRAPEAAQLDWLRTQLADARAHHEHVWLMSHIPPGVDVYTSFRRYLLQPAGLCNAAPRAFLADTALPDALLDYADTVRLALFGHTHMDEIRLMHRGASGVSNGEGIPAKLVPSVSPYIGNHPAFLVATVDPGSAILKDWRTFVSPSPEGSTPPWTAAYRFTAAFGVPDFSAASAEKLTAGFTADKSGQSPESTAFRQHYFPGDFGLYALGLAQIWPAFACSAREQSPSAVHDCVCAAVSKP